MSRRSSFRVGSTLGARTHGQLASLVSDLLPMDPAATERPRWAARLRSLLPQARSEPIAPVLLPAYGEPTVIVGRNPDCTVSLSDRSVSRRHLSLAASEDGWIARDLGSLNGTWLEDRRLGRARVLPGDELQLGEAALVLVSAVGLP